MRRSAERIISLATVLLALALAMPVWSDASTSPLADIAQADTIHLQRIMDVEDARHLLMRTGIGASPADVRTVLGMTRQAAIDHIVTGMSIQPAIPMPAWVNQPLPHYHARPNMDDEARVRFNNERRAEFAQLRQWWVLNMLETPSPQTERMVLFWHDVFATNYHDLDRQSLAMARQNQTFRTLGFGSWERLLKAMIRDPALLQFLNVGSNHKASPNENLARELMELFVLGEGHYDEADVREAARSLTGHNASRWHDLQFRLKTWAQDRNDKQLFGRTGPFDGDDLIDILLTQDAAPRFLARRFWHAFIADTEAESAWLSRQAELFGSSGFNIPTLYRNVLQSQAFWHLDNRAAIIKSPVDLVVGTARTLEYPKHSWQKMAQWQAMIGMDLFAPPNVAGWNEGAAFISPGHLLNRYKIVRQLLKEAKPVTPKAGMSAQAGPMTQSSMSEAMDMSGPMMDTATDDTISARLTLAADDFEGPAKYRVSLLADEQMLWQSPPRTFPAGRDTSMMGRLQNEGQIAWHSVEEALPAIRLEQATHVRVHFLNDRSNANGDRNLYVDSVQINEQHLPADRGFQHSRCAPPLQANAGKLYCAGFVELSLEPFSMSPATPVSAAAGDSIVRASAVHAQWGKANKNNGKRTLELVIDHLQTPEKAFHHIRFTLEKKSDTALMMQLDSFSCWPDCIEQWPDCAWRDEHFSAARQIALPWVASSSELWSDKHAHRCQYEQLSADEQRLVSTLWASLPDILALAERTNRVQIDTARWLPIIEFLLQAYRGEVNSLADTPYAELAATLDVQAAHAPPQIARRPLPKPTIVLDEADSVMSALSAMGVPLHDLLIPYLPEQSTGLAASNETARSGPYLRQLVEHPLFQLK